MKEIFDYCVNVDIEEIKRDCNVDKLFMKYYLNVPNYAQSYFRKYKSSEEFNKTIKPYFRDVTINYSLDNWNKKVIELKKIYAYIKNMID